MNLDHFLDFWSRYNQTIIQSLIVVTLIFIVALVFITLFGSKNEGSGNAQVGLSPELEKSLQKMLDNQTKAAVFDFSKAQENGAPSSIATQVGAASSEAIAQLESLKSEMAAKEKKIQELNTQLSQAVSQSTKELKVDNSGADSRVSELEARLAEYDIISEDIADLSRYKQENEKIKAELASLKSGGASSSQMESVAATAPIAPPELNIAAAATQPDAFERIIQAPDLQVVSSDPNPSAVPPESPEIAANAAIDDDLMKEFAAAVEGQKVATQATAVPAPGADSEDLMGQFENFVQKKEGS